MMHACGPPRAAEGRPMRRRARGRTPRLCSHAPARGTGAEAGGAEYVTVLPCGAGRRRAGQISGIRRRHARTNRGPGGPGRQGSLALRNSAARGVWRGSTCAVPATGLACLEGPVQGGMDGSCASTSLVSLENKTKKKTRKSIKERTRPTWMPRLGMFTSAKC